jgi:hypothetical protein
MKQGYWHQKGKEHEYGEADSTHGKTVLWWSARNVRSTL